MHHTKADLPPWRWNLKQELSEKSTANMYRNAIHVCSDHISIEL